MLTFPSTSSAQNPELDEVNLQLRSMFSPLSKPLPSKKFLYEMSAHSTDSIWYVANCADTNQTEEWVKVYEEMYYAAYDTTALPKSDIILENVNNIGTDSIPIGIMNFSYYGLKEDAMNTNIYFNFDTINNVLTDRNPRPSFPYTDNNTIFMSSPLKYEANFSNPVFIIDPKYFYYDTFNADKFSKTAILQINFDDGTGWHNYDPTIISYYQPDYSTTANLNPTIIVRQASNGNTGIFGSSQSRFVTGGIASVPPDEILLLPGLNTGIYNGCNTNASTGKTVIYLEGIDILDFLPSKNRNVRTIYNEMLRNDKIIQLKNQGYKFVVVDWKNSRIDMRFNALYVVNLLQALKRRSTDDQQFIVMGESMGGVIARYALTYMESREYTAQNIAPFFTEQNDLQSQFYLAANPAIYSLPSNWDKLEKMHNTRLFISIDAPHRGANVPLSIQKAYKNTFGILGPYFGTALSLTTYAFNLFLDGKATKQLLIEHVSTESGSGFYKTYRSSPVRTSFMNQLEGMGSYPQFAKVMLMSNGALSGANQYNYYRNVPRTPGDRLIDFKTQLYARILGIKIPIFGATLDARTNPDGSGKILSAIAGRYNIKIKLRWFGIKIYADYNSLLNIQNYATTRPYCTSAGSYQGSRVGLVSQQGGQNGYRKLSEHWLFNLYSYTNINDGLGCVNFKSHVGWNGFLSANVDFSLCTDGPSFGFIPVQSALDYGSVGTLGLNTNIEGLDINTKLANIPAIPDVMVGNSNLEINPTSGLLERVGGKANKQHLDFRNDPIFNVSNNESPAPVPNTYFSCIGNSPGVTRGFLNLEVGDEELYLENNSLPYRAEYKVEYDIHLNERNRYYQYPSTILGAPNSQILRGIYSKQDAYSIKNTGFATFIYDVFTGPPPALNNTGFFGTTTGNFTSLIEPLANCCVNFNFFKGTKLDSKIKLSNLETGNYIKLFPNPNAGDLLTIQYQFKTVSNVNMSIIDAVGKEVYRSILFIPFAKKQINTVLDLKKLKLVSGLYFVRLSNGKELLSSKLIVAN